MYKYLTWSTNYKYKKTKQPRPNRILFVRRLLLKLINTILSNLCINQLFVPLYYVIEHLFRENKTYRAFYHIPPVCYVFACLFVGNFHPLLGRHNWNVVMLSHKNWFILISRESEKFNPDLLNLQRQNQIQLNSNFCCDLPH